MPSLGDIGEERFRLARPLAGDFADAEVDNDSDDEEKQDERQPTARPSNSRRKALTGVVLCLGLFGVAACWVGRPQTSASPAAIAGEGANALIREHIVGVARYRRLPDSFCQHMERIRPVQRGVSWRVCEAKCSATPDCGAYMMIENRDDCALLSGCDTPSHSSVGTYVMLKAVDGADDVDIDADVIGSDVEEGVDAHHDHSLGALVRLQGRLGSLDVELVAREEGLVLPEGGQGLHAGDDHDAVLAWSAHYDHTVPSGSDAATDDHHAIQYDAEDNDDALPGGAHTSTDHDDAIPGDAQARDLRLRSRLGELAPRMVRREEGLVLSALWKGMQSTPGRDHYDPIPQSPNAPIGLRLRCRFLQLDHLLVRGEEGLVL